MSDTNGTSTTRIQMRNKKNLETHLNGKKDISKDTIGFFFTEYGKHFKLVEFIKKRRKTKQKSKKNKKPLSK